MRLSILIFAFLAFKIFADDTVTRLSEPVEVTEAYEVFGAPLPDKNPGLSLKELIDREAEYSGSEVRVSTRIAKVCRKKGCFFIATEGDAQARITFADYEFFIPTDSGGKQVTLVGTFSRQELSPGQAAHYQQDLGETVEKPRQPVFEYSIVATSVLIPRS